MPQDIKEETLQCLMQWEVSLSALSYYIEHLFEGTALNLE